MPTIAPDTQYDRSCINMPACRDDNEQAAMYDYVADVYTSQSSFDYDGTLTGQERAYVERIFGFYDVSRGPMAYLSNVHARVTARLQEPEYCARPQGRTISRNYESTTHGSGLAIGGSHYCITNFFDAYRNVELNVAANPEDWMFFLEGVSATTNLGSSEIGYANNIARNLNIPISEAVMQTNDPLFIEAANQQFGYTKMDIAVATLLSYTVVGFTLPKSEFYDGLFGLAHETAQNFELDENALLLAYDKKIKVSENETREEKLSEISALQDEFVSRYLALANTLSPQRIQEQQQKNPQDNALFVFGKKHMPIADQVFEE